MDPFEKLKQSKQLLEEGMITEEEYEKLRKQFFAEIGSEKKDDFVGQVTTGTQSDTVNNIQTPTSAGTVISEEGATTGMKALSFLLPLVGLILFLVNQNTKPAEAKDELKWAAIGFGIWLLCYLLLASCGAAYYY